MSVTAIKKDETLLPAVPKASPEQRQKYAELNQKLSENVKFRGALQDRLNELRQESVLASPVEIRSLESRLEVLLTKKSVGDDTPETSAEIEQVKTDLSARIAAEKAAGKMKGVSNEIVLLEQKNRQLNQEKKALENAVRKSAFKSDDLQAAIDRVNLEMMTTFEGGQPDVDAFIRLHWSEERYIQQRVALEKASKEALQ